MKNLRNLFLPVMGTLALSWMSTPLAQTHKHGAHVHDVAELTLATNGTALEISLIAPAINIVGFESEAASAAQLEAVASARTQLTDTGTLFRFTGAACTLQNVSIDLSAVAPSSTEPSSQAHHDDLDDHHSHHHGEDRGYHASDHNSHDTAHNQDNDQASEHHDHADGGHDSGHKHHNTASTRGHTDVTADYQFECDGELAEGSVTLGAEQLPFGFNKVNAMWLTATRQGATTLTPENRIITFN